MLKRSLESTLSLCIDWPDTMQSILGDEFLNQEEMMMTNTVESDRFGNESSMDLSLHSGLYTDLEPDPKHMGKLNEPILVSSPESSCKAVRDIPKTPTKTSISNSCRRRKKPRGMPKRPLSAYNVFFQTQRTVVQAQAKKENKLGSKGLGFEGLGKLIGKQWKELGKEEKKKYEILAEKDSSRYREEMDEYNRRKKELIEKEKIRQRLTSVIGIEAVSACQHYPKFVITQPKMSASSFDPRQGDRADDLLKCRPPDFVVNKTSAENVVVGSPEDPSSMSIVPPGKFLFPPGMEIVMRDNTGRHRKYRVEYKCYKMSRAEASRYVESISSSFRHCDDAQPDIPQDFIEAPNGEMTPI